MDHFADVYQDSQSYHEWFLRYGAWQTFFFPIWKIFCPLNPLAIWKIKIFKKWQKHLAILSIYTYVSWTQIILLMVPETYGRTYKVFYHFEQFFALLPSWQPKKSKFSKWKKYLKIFAFYTCVPQMMIIWCSGTNRTFCQFEPFFALLSPNNLEDQNLGKMKRNSEYIIIFHMCTINGNHMIYCFWDREQDRQNVLSFWAIFCSLPHLQPGKLKFGKNDKNTWRYYVFTHMCHKYRFYNLLFLRHMAERTFYHLGLFSALLPS